MSFRTKAILSWIFRCLAAIILLQTLFFKFTGAEESIYIFSRLGIEPWGRIGSGVMELIASILILIPRTTAIGSLLALGIMSGAILMHFLFLGISVQNDGGQLFLYAVLVFISALLLLIWHWHQLIRLLPARFVSSKLSKI